MLPAGNLLHGGAAAERGFGFFQLPVPIADYDAEPWGGVAVITAQAGFGNVEIIEIENFRRELDKLAAKIGDKQVFWKPFCLLSTALGQPCSPRRLVESNFPCCVNEP